MGKYFRLLCRTLFIITLICFVWCLLCFEDYSEKWPENTYKKRISTTLIVIHHDAINHQTTPDDIQIYHRDSLKWESGIAYTFFLMGEKVYQTKKLDQCGGHAFGFNQNSIGVCVHTPDKYNIITRINLWLITNFLMFYYDLDETKVKGHGELPNQKETICPDLNMDSLRNSLIPLKILTKMSKIPIEKLKELKYGYFKDDTVAYFDDTPIDFGDNEEVESYEDEESLDSNDNQTIIKHDSNDSQTIVEHDSNDSQTIVEQPLTHGQLQTLAANIEKLSQNATTPKKIVELYPDVVCLLTNKEICKSVIGRKKPKHFFSVPKELCQYIRQSTNRGELKDNKIAKIWLSYNYQRRFSPLTFWIAIISLIALFIFIYPTPTKGVNEIKIESNEKISLDLKKIVREWEKKNKFYFSGWRLKNQMKLAPSQDIEKFLLEQKQKQGTSFSEPQNWE